MAEPFYRDETLAERDARLNAWLATVSPGDIVTVRLNSTDVLSGKVYEAPDAGREDEPDHPPALYVYTTLLRHGNGLPGGSFELVLSPVETAATHPAAAQGRETAGGGE